MTIRPFTRELRRQGFVFCYRDRGGGCVVTEFAKRQGDRTVRVQFWDHDQAKPHRVSHETHSALPGGGEGTRATTLPVYFGDVPEMLLVILAEWKRPSGVPGEPWQREPSSDKRIADGDDFAADAWRSCATNELKLVAVGHHPDGNVQACRRVRDGATGFKCDRCESIWTDMLHVTGWRPPACPERRTQ